MHSKTRIQVNLEREFDSFATNYSEDMVKCVPYYLDLIESFAADYPPLFTPKNILDIGSGNGNVTAQILKLFPKANYTLLDASQSMLDASQIRFAEYSISYVKAYFEDFNFKPNYFDLVTAGFSLHHCSKEEKQFIFKCIYKALKPGGIFSSSDLMINKNNPDHQDLMRSWKRFVIKNYSSKEKWKWLKEHYDEFDKPDNFIDQISWLENIGFKTIYTKLNENYWAHFKVIKP